SGTVDLYFDGDGAAGLNGKTIQAIATYPDGDQDSFPDGIDDCPAIPNPGQEDADGDGIGDPCDYCPARPDPTCHCGDGVVDPPAEECDLGASNGAPGSLCTATCTTVGHCTGSQASCHDAGDCP